MVTPLSTLFKGCESDIWSVCKYKDILISGCENGQIRFWKDKKTEILLKTSIQASFMRIMDSSLILCGRSTKLGSSCTVVSIWDISKITKSQNPTEICRGSTDQGMDKILKKIENSNCFLKF